MSAGVQELRIADIAERHRTAMHRHIFDHADHEVGGVIVGRIDGRTGRSRVTGVIPALEAVGERASVTFTHEAWETILERQEEEFPNTQIVGWYHSHPGFGIFLSEHDLFIHRNFFGDQHQFAYVVDPIEHSEGIFGWRDGEVAMFECIEDFSTAHVGGTDGGLGGNGPEGVPIHKRDLAAPPRPAAGTGKLTIGLDDLAAPEVAPDAEGTAAPGLVVGDDVVGGARRRLHAAPAPGAGIGSPVGGPRRPVDPRAEQESQAARRRRGLLAGAAGVVLVAGVSLVIATGSGGDERSVNGVSVTDEGVKDKAQANAKRQREAAQSFKAAGIAALAAENKKSVDAYKLKRVKKAATSGGGDDGLPGQTQTPATATPSKPAVKPATPAPRRTPPASSLPGGSIGGGSG